MFILKHFLFTLFNSVSFNDFLVLAAKFCPENWIFFRKPATALISKCFLCLLWSKKFIYPSSNSIHPSSNSFQSFSQTIHSLSNSFRPFRNYFHFISNSFQTLSQTFRALATHFNPLAKPKPLAKQNPLARNIIKNCHPERSRGTSLTINFLNNNFAIHR